MSDHYKERRARRERIATACLAGMLASNYDGPVDMAADWAVCHADALMAALDAPTMVRHIPTGGAE